MNLKSHRSGTLLNFIEKQTIFRRHKNTPNTGKINSRKNDRPKKQRKVKEILGERCRGLDGGKCLESETNSRRSADVWKIRRGNKVQKRISEKEEVNSNYYIPLTPSSWESTVCPGPSGGCGRCSIGASTTRYWTCHSRWGHRTSSLVDWVIVTASCRCCYAVPSRVARTTSPPSSSSRCYESASASTPSAGTHSRYNSGRLS